MLSHGRTGGITPMSRSRPSAKSARTTQPTHILIIEALRLCLRIAASIISCTSARVTESSSNGSIIFHLQKFCQRISPGFYNFTGSFIKHVICISRCLKSFLNFHPVFIGVLVHAILL